MLRKNHVGFAPWLLLVFSAFPAHGFSAENLPPVIANPNHSPAGVLRDGVLTVELEIARGEWYPENDDGMALSVYAFGEAGHPLQNPGPLICVPQGTEVRASVHNKLAVPITVHGLSDSGSDSAVHLDPGATEQVQFKATIPGLFFYWGRRRFRT